MFFDKLHLWLLVFFILTNGCLNQNNQGQVEKNKTIIKGNLFEIVCPNSVKKVREENETIIFQSDSPFLSEFEMKISSKVFSPKNLEQHYYEYKDFLTDIEHEIISEDFSLTNGYYNIMNINHKSLFKEVNHIVFYYLIQPSEQNCIFEINGQISNDASTLGLALVKEIVESFRFINTIKLEEGKTLFNRYCASCHNKDMVSSLTGPPLGGITEKRSKEWLYEFTRNSQKMVTNGDKDAIAVFEKYSQTVMPDFSFMAEYDLDQIYLFVEEEFRNTK